MRTKTIILLIVFVIEVSSANPAVPLKCDAIKRSIDLNEIKESNPIVYKRNWMKDISHPVINFLKFLGQKKVKKIYNDIKKGIETKMSCNTCELVLSLAKISVYSESELNYLMSGICRSFRFEDKRVCSGLSDLFAEELYFILRNTKLSRSEICATLIGAKCLTQPCARHDFWAIELDSKPKPKPNLTESSQNSYGRQEKKAILHLSDLHIDPYYVAGASTDCGEPLCCRTTSARGKGKAGYWGDYEMCDSPKYTIEQMMSHINTSLALEYDYIIWTGDIVAHDVWNTTKQTIINGSRSLTSLINKYISNGKLVFPVIGNHEGWPVNQFAPPEITGHLSIGWLYEELLNQWSEWIPKEYTNTFKSYGYYANNVSPNLKVIVLNSNYCARLNFWLMYKPSDPGSQLKWLVNELNIAEQSGQSVHIVGHIPPDNTQCTAQWVHKYLRIIDRYSDVIKGQFFGHTHFDEVRILYSPANQSIPIGVAYLTPSVTTYEKVNPAFRRYTIDSEGTVLDHQNYYINLTEANKNAFESPVQWIDEYSAKSSYNMSSLVPSDWNLVYHKMKSDDHLFQTYYSHYHRYSDAFSSECPDELRQQILQSIPVYDPISCK